MGGVECTGNNFFIRNVESTGYVDWNWIELTNFYNNNGSCYEKEGWIITASGTDHDTWNNFYIHAATAGASSVDIDNMITSPTTGNCANCLVNYAVIDNSDGTKYTSGGIRIPIQHSICTYVSNCIKPFTGGEYAYNNITHIGAVIAGVHANCIETIGATSGPPYYIHDNLIHDINRIGVLRRLAGRQSKRDRLRLEQHLVQDDEHGSEWATAPAELLDWRRRLLRME